MRKYLIGLIIALSLAGCTPFPKRVYVIGVERFVAASVDGPDKPVVVLHYAIDGRVNAAVLDDDKELESYLAYLRSVR